MGQQQPFQLLLGTQFPGQLLRPQAQPAAQTLDAGAPIAAEQAQPQP